MYKIKKIIRLLRLYFGFRSLTKKAINNWTGYKYFLKFKENLIIVG